MNDTGGISPERLKVERGKHGPGCSFLGGCKCLGNAYDELDRLKAQLAFLVEAAMREESLISLQNAVVAYSRRALNAEDKLSSLTKERDDLASQVKRWEDKEARRGHDCSAMEDERDALKAQIHRTHETVGKIVEGRDALRLRTERLERALTLVRRWHHDGNHNEVFERIAEWFWEDTGIMRPGKSQPLEGPHRGDEERRAAWDKWVASKRREISDTIDRALLQEKP